MGGYGIAIAIIGFGFLMLVLGPLVGRELKRQRLYDDELAKQRLLRELRDRK